MLLSRECDECDALWAAGSEKYPDENEFEAFLSAHGGFSNGATDNEITSYTFEVGPAHLEQALDMFAQFFISPLMKADAMERELSAIESEFNQATQSDRVRTQVRSSDPIATIDFASYSHVTIMTAASAVRCLATASPVPPIRLGEQEELA